MKRILEAFIALALLLPAVAVADIQHNYPNISVEADGATGNVSLVPKTTGYINAAGSVKITTSGKGFVRYPAVVVTPVAAATSRADAPIVQDLTVVAAAAPTANFVQLPDVDVNLGRIFQVWNKSANPVVIYPQDTDAINATAVGTPYSCATTKLCECSGMEAALYACVSK